jgi:hypothetical protein
MAILALGLVGAAVGSAVGGTFLGIAAASWGFMAGELAGNLLFPQKQSGEGPRVGDLSVQSSTYGTPVPILYGTMRVAGNVIFSTKKREEKNEQTSGGKGGPKITTTTYTYNIDMAVALCEGPIEGIRKMWLNGKLVYDASADAGAESTAASSIHADGWVVYHGDETQLPDPTIEATVGAGLTPAYRGLAYVVFNHLDCPNGQVPQLSFEVVASGGAADSNPVFSVVPSASPTMYASILDNQAWQFKSSVAMNPVQRVGPDFYSREGVADFTDPTGQSTLAPVPVQGGVYAMFATFSAVTYTHPMSLISVRLDTKVRTVELTYTPDTSANSLRPAYVAYDSVSERFCAVGNGVDGTDRSEYITIFRGNVLSDALMTGSTPLAYYDSVIYTCGISGGITYLNSYDGDTGVLLDSISSGANNGAISLLVHADANGVYVIDNEADDITLDRHVWKVDADGWHVLTSTAHYDNLAGFTNTWWSNDQYGIVGPGGVSGGNGTYRMVRYNAVESTDVVVGDIIEDIAERAGLTPAQLDTTDCTDEVHGFLVAQVSPARNSTDSLVRSFFIDAIESDGQLKFQRRYGKTPVASIPYDDLGAIDPGGQSVDPFPLMRTQEAELPRSVALTYYNFASDYQPGTEMARRQVTSSINDFTDQLPIAASPEQMSTTASTLLYDAWAMRTARSTALTRAYAYLDVGDNVTVEYPRGTLTNKRLTKITDTGQMLQVEMVDSDPSVYGIVSPGATPANPQDGVEFIGPTRMAFLDIPILRDTDNDPGLYGAFEGYANTWEGALVYVGDRRGNNTLVSSITTEVTSGVAMTALGDWLPNLIDETNSVDIQLTKSTLILSSTTRAGMLNGTTNFCIIGNELLQFRTATSLGSGLYRLTGLRRGRQGTEWARSTHVVGDQFFLLQGDGLLRLPMDLADIDVSLNYEATTFGQDPSIAISQAFTNTCVGLKPMAPANFDVAQSGDTLALRWVRRTRLRENWLAGTVPLGEASESYEIDVVPVTGGVLTYESTSSPLLINAITYTPESDNAQRGAQRAVKVGSFIYGLDYSGALVKFTATGLVYVTDSTVNGNNVVGSCSGLAVSGSNIYTVSYGNPPTVPARLRKWDVDTNLVASVELPQYSGFGFNTIVVCAGSLWVGLDRASILRRYDPATMLPLADVAIRVSSLGTDGTYVYGVGLDGTSIYKVDPATNTVATTYALTSPCSELAVAGGYVFYNAGAGLNIMRLSDGAPMTNPLASDVVGRFCTYGNYVGITYGSQSFAVVNASTLSLYGAFQLTQVRTGFSANYYAQLITQDQVVGNSYMGGQGADLYDRAVLGAGTVFNLYQMSADVGRGFAATRTL